MRLCRVECLLCGKWRMLLTDSVDRCRWCGGMVMVDWGDFVIDEEEVRRRMRE